MLALIAGGKTPFATARFANLGHLDEISQLGSGHWHSKFCEL